MPAHSQMSLLNIMTKQMLNHRDLLRIGIYNSKNLISQSTGLSDHTRKMNPKYLLSNIEAPQRINNNLHSGPKIGLKILKSPQGTRNQNMVL